MSLISGTENVALSPSMPGALWRMYMSRFSSRLTSGLSSTPRTSVKMAAFAPIPSASVRITMVASPLLRISEWNATLRSRKNDMFIVPSAEFISTKLANSKTHIGNHLLWVASLDDGRFRQLMSKFGHRLGNQILRHDFSFSCNGLRVGRLPCLHYIDERPGRNSTNRPRKFPAAAAIPKQTGLWELGLKPKSW